ncbi:MAG: hypothetical protein C5B50_12755 [Verrucomicrobia bacterium]|nr:MAG: hypothetical protein C5B50_12755 [Verrucomicrobiota bacterium]
MILSNPKRIVACSSALRETHYPRSFELLTSLVFALILLSAAIVRAQPVRLAIVPEDPSLSSEADYLTVELSHRANVEVLERAQINRILKEQSSSLNNPDFLRLGEILGADGVISLNSVSKEQGSHLVVRLGAVRPGILLDLVDYPQPLDDRIGWSKIVAQRFSPYFSKLRVPAKEALPISFLNIRSAVRFTAGESLERQMNTLLVLRLMSRKEFFVLERQKLQLLAREKDLKGVGDAPFWTGSYLLEGTLDKGGYNAQTLTLSARLTPPGGPSPINVELSGKRSNPLLLVDELATRILSEITKRPQTNEWNALEEANRYFDEASWALKWLMIPEAQAAADSAWELGRRDLDCALVRVKAHTLMATLDGPYYRWDYNEVYPEAAESPPRRPTDTWLRETLSRFHSALTMLEAYEAFTPTNALIKTGPDTSWYAAGLESLRVASQVLQLFHLRHDLQIEAADQLPELRLGARVLASRLSIASPGQHQETLLKYKIDFGCLWQESPEDCVTFYRKLLTNSSFLPMNGRLCYRPPARPRLTAWTAADKKRMPVVWSRFLNDLTASTNLFWPLEAKCFKVADGQMSAGDLVVEIFTNHDQLVTNDQARLDLQTRFDPFFQGVGGPIHEAYAKASFALDQDAQFVKQKRYLTNPPRFNPIQFARLFDCPEYSKDRALELEPLVETYNSNFLSNLPANGGTNKWEQRQALGLVHDLQAKVTLYAHPEKGGPGYVILTDYQALPLSYSSPSPSSRKSEAPRIAHKKKTPLPEMASVTNSLAITQFFKIPRQRIRLKEIPGDGTVDETLTIRGHNVIQDKLCLELHCPQRNAVWAAVLDPKTSSWEIFECPKGENYSAYGWGAGQAERRLNFGIFHGALFFTERSGQVFTCNLTSRRWDRRLVSLEKSSYFFPLADHLYAANEECIVELLDGGDATHLLAARRRRPALSSLDSSDWLGDVVLIPGPTNSVRAFLAGRVFQWSGNDWTPSAQFPPGCMPEIGRDGTLIRGAGREYRFDLWLLPHESTNAILCLHEDSDHAGRTPPGYPIPDRLRRKPLTIPNWENLPDASLVQAPATTSDSKIYFLLGQYDLTNGPPNMPHIPFVPKPGGPRRSDLVRLDPDTSKPIVVPIILGAEPRPTGSYALDLNLVLISGGWPSRGYGHGLPWSAPEAWMAFAGDFLLIGHESRAGVWAIPKAEIDAAFEREKIKRNSKL